MIRKLSGSLFLSVVFLTLFGCAEPQYAVKLTWSAPETNSDGSPLTDLAGFELSYGSAPGDYSRKILIPIDDKRLHCDISEETKSGAVKKCSFTVSGLKQGDYYFVIAAYNSSGAKSVNSNEVKKTAQRVP